MTLTALLDRVLPAAGGGPAPVTRDAARRAAHEELQHRIYARAQPSLVQRAYSDLVRWLQRLLRRLLEVTPGRGLGLLVLLGLAGLVAVLVLRRLGPLHRSAARPGPVLDVGSGPVSAARLRQQSEEAAAQARWADAVRLRMRAVARSLEERGVLDPRPGRTASELAAEVAVSVGELGPVVRDAARSFEQVCYGGRVATPQAYDQVRRADDALAARRAVAAQQRPTVPA